jgi:hypothetical protein
MYKDVIDLESQLIAAAIEKPHETIPQTSCEPHEFLYKNHEDLWAAILYLYDKGIKGKIDAIVLSDHSKVSREEIDSILRCQADSYKPDYWSRRVSEL